MYLNTSTFNTYRCTTAGNASSAKWTYSCNIKGATGAKGNTGATGAPGSVANLTADDITTLIEDSPMAWGANHYFGEDVTIGNGNLNMSDQSGIY